MSHDATAATAKPSPLAEEERLRADLYLLLAHILAAPPDQTQLNHLATLTGDQSDLGRGITALSRLSAATAPKAVEREFNALFVGVGRGELLPFASYYLTGFLNEKPLARLRDHMALLGIAPDPTTHEPEDHIATLCEMMAGLITGQFGEPLALKDQEAFFNSHLATWASHFFTDLEGAEGSLFYAPVGKIGRAFMEIEFEAFRLNG